MQTQEIIQRAADVLTREAPLGSRVYLFGSQARGQATERSDIDFLVVEPEVTHRFAETNRLYRALRWMRVPFDLIVVSQATFDEWRDVPCSLPNEVVREGRLLNAPQ